jgi:predicted dehydrogenase
MNSPQATHTVSPSPICWGILGTGHIAQQFYKALQSEEDTLLTAVASRTRESAQRFQSQYPVKMAYESYDALLRNESIQAVYIALPNHLHAEWVIKAAEHGKHILCEKPFTTNAAEAERVLKAIKPFNVCLMEGFLYRHHPQTTLLLQLIQERVIGDITHLQTDFSFDLGLKYENIRMNHAFAGGGIMDVGCYAVSMVRLLAGAAAGKPFLNPTVVQGVGLLDPRSGVDLWAAATLRFETGLEAALTCATQTAGERKLRLFGSEGTILVENPWKPQPSDTIKVQRFSEAQPQILQHGATLAAFPYEVRHFQSRIALGATEVASSGMTWADSLGNMQALDAWRSAIGLKFPQDW